MTINSILVHNCLNEVLHGISASTAALPVLERKAEIEQLFKEWKTSPNSKLLCRNRSLIADVIEVVCSELGEGEFDTRTGVGLDEARTYVRALRTAEGKG